MQLTKEKSETFRWPQPPLLFRKCCRTNGGRTAIQMGGVPQYKWEAHCGVSLSSKLRSQESTAILMGGVLPYKLRVYCCTFQTSCRGWGFRNIAQKRVRPTKDEERWLGRSSFKGVKREETPWYGSLKRSLERTKVSWTAWRQKRVWEGGRFERVLWQREKPGKLRTCRGNTKTENLS